MVMVDVENDDGAMIFRAPVYIEYVKEIDNRYGEDADGNRGVPMIEYSVLDKFMDTCDLKRMRSDQVERALESGEALFFREPVRYTK